MNSNKNNFMEHISRSIVIVSPLVGLLFLYDVPSVFYVISFFLLFVVFAVSYLLQRTENFKLFSLLIFSYVLFFSLILSSYWLSKVSLLGVLLIVFSDFVISSLISSIVSFAVHYKLFDRYSSISADDSKKGDVHSKQKDSEELSNLESELAYIKSNFVLVSDDISGELEPKLKAVNDSLENAKSELERNFQDYMFFSMNLSELYDSCSYMKNRLSSSLGYINRMISILQKYSEMSESLRVPFDKIKLFSFSHQGYSDLYVSQISDLRDKAKKLEVSLDSLPVKDSDSEILFDIRSVVFSIKTSIVEFLRIHYNSYVVSLKTVQIASTSGSSFVRKSLLAIIQDIDSFSFKLNVQINKILQFFSDFDPQVVLFDASIREKVKKITQLKSRVRRVRDMYYGSIQRRLLSFEEKFSNISNIFVESSFDRVEDLRKRVEIFGGSFEKSKVMISSNLMSSVKMLKDIENISQELENFISFLSEYKSIVEKDILPRLNLSNYRIPRMLKKTLTSKRVLEEVNKFIISSGEDILKQDLKQDINKL